MGTALSQHEINTIKNLVEEHGGEVAAALNTFSMLKEQGIPIETVIASYDNSNAANEDDIEEAIANEGGNNQATEHQDTEAQAGNALSEQAAALGRHADGKLAGSQINRQAMQFGDYLNQWFDTIKNDLETNGEDASQKNIHKEFLKTAKLVGKITPEQLESLTTKNSDGIYESAPDKRLANHIYKNIKDSELRTPRRSFFLDAAKAAIEASSASVELQQKTNKKGKQFGDYLTKWLESIEEDLRESGKDTSQENIYTSFREQTGLIKHLSNDDIEALTTKTEKGNYQAAPDEHLCDYLAMEVHKSEHYNTSGHYIIRSGETAREGSDTTIYLDKNVSIRHVSPERMMAKIMLHECFQALNLPLEKVAEKANITDGTLSEYLSPYRNMLPQKNIILSAIAPDDAIKKTLDAVIAQATGYTGKQPLKSSFYYLLAKEGIHTNDIHSSITNHINIKSVFDNSQELVPLKTMQNRVIVKSWLHAHTSEGQYEHIGIARNLAQQGPLQNVENIAWPPQQEALDCATFQSIKTNNFSIHSYVKFIAENEGIELQKLGKDLNIRPIKNILGTHQRTAMNQQERTSIDTWIQSTTEHPKYDTIRKLLPNEKELKLLLDSKTNPKLIVDESPNVENAFQLAEYIIKIENTDFSKLSESLETRKINDLLNPSPSVSHKMNAAERRKIGTWMEAALFDENGENKFPNTPNKKQVHNMLNQACVKRLVNTYVEPEDISTLQEIYTYLESYELSLPNVIGSRERKTAKLVESNGLKMNYEERQIVKKHIFDALDNPLLEEMRDQLPSNEDIERMLNEQTSRVVLEAPKTPKDVNTILDLGRFIHVRINSQPHTPLKRLTELLSEHIEKKMSLPERQDISQWIYDALDKPPLEEMRDQLPSNEKIEEMLDEQTAKSVLKARDTTISGASPAVDVKKVSGF